MTGKKLEMTGKRMTNTSGKGRNSYQNAANHQVITSMGKKLMKPSSMVASTNATASTASKISPSMANNNFNTVSPAVAVGGVVGVPIPPQTNHSTLIKTSENTKYIPRYVAALTKPPNDLFPAEELDAIQLELELLLSTVALRYRSLKSGIESMDREEKNHKKSGKYVSSVGSGKRKRDETNKKSMRDMKSAHSMMKLTKLKPNSSDSTEHKQPQPHSQPHFRQQQHQPRPQQPEPSADEILDALANHQSLGSANLKLLLPKNDIPNKFWLSVEPYCMPITHEDVKLLDDMIEEYSGPMIPPIPELGPHYTSRWAAEDLRDEQDNSNPHAKANKRFTSAANPDVNNMMKKGEKALGDGVTGPLTQRLIAALLEENLMNSRGDILGASDGVSTMANESNDSCGENNSSSANRTSITPIASLLKNGIDVELRLKKELIELGILDINDFPKEKDDEVLNEIKRVRTELESIAQYNLNELKQLRAAAQEEMKRLEIKRKLDLIDQELIDSYRRVFSAKQKRRPLTKQEKTAIYRLIDSQKRLADQLEAMPFPGFDQTLNHPKRPK